MKPITHVTLIGLGKMGSAIAKKLLEANFDLTVYNRTAEKMTPLVKAGAKAADSASKAVQDADVVLTCLLDDNSVLQTVAGENGFLKALKPNAIHLGTSTILPSTSKKLQQLHQAHNSIYLVGNVLGVPKVAEKGELTSFMGGPTNAIHYCMPLLQTYSKKIITISDEPYKANAMKICTNYMLATAIESMGEIYTYAEKSGLDKTFIQEMFHAVFASPVFNLYVDKIKERNFDEVNFDLKAGFKDLNLFQQAFTEVQVVPDIANIIKNKFITALAQGMGEKDWSAVTDITRMQAGLK